MGRGSWITQVGPKCNHKSPCRRETEEDMKTERRLSDDRSRDWRDVVMKNANSYQKLEEARNGFSPGASRTPADIWILAPEGSFQNSGLQNSKRRISVVLSHQVCSSYSSNYRLIQWVKMLNLTHLFVPDHFHSVHPLLCLFSPNIGCHSVPQADRCSSGSMPSYVR